MVIAVIAKINHGSEKVPGWEQMLTAGAATYAIQLAGNALGFEVFWATGLSLRDVNYVKHLDL